uniref:Retrotransposon gag domain-containing protein n=1 Tax=Cannabis sativa TaxID=3483 RepID=A0A803NHB7_CANSA
MFSQQCSLEDQLHQFWNLDQLHLGNEDQTLFSHGNDDVESRANPSRGGFQAIEPYAPNRHNGDSNHIAPPDRVRGNQVNEGINAIQPQATVDKVIHPQWDELIRLVRDFTAPKLIDLEQERMRGSTFSETINDLPILPKFKMPTCKYTSKEDPLIYFENFKIHMDLQGRMDDLRCRIFPTTLTKTAQQWFTKLPQEGSLPWMSLKGYSIPNFSSDCQIPVELGGSVAIKQRLDESLKDYIQHIKFKVEYETLITSLKLEREVKFEYSTFIVNPN